MDSLKPDEPVSNGQYEVLTQVKGCLGGPLQYVGSKGPCRFCGEKDESRFRKVAHTFPEALGNKWVISHDECDCCNQAFSSYESALVSAVGPILALGGVSGKTTSDRQVGRSEGARVLRHSVTNGKRNLQVLCKGIGLDGIEPHLTPTGLIKLKTPVAATPFKPRMAYKAIAKMGMALLPDEELGNFHQLRAWLRDQDDRSEFRNLGVSMSFASIGNSPDLVCGTLLRRVNREGPLPHILFIFCAGSVCLQISLMCDRVDENLSRTPPGRISINWKSVLQHPESEDLVFDYGSPIQLDWSSPDSQPQPIDFFWFEFNPSSCEGSFVPVFRPGVTG